jgi:hypothetical protein
VLIQPEGGTTADVRYPSAADGWACLGGGLLPIQTIKRITQRGWSAFLTVIAGKQDCFLETSRGGGPGLPGGASLRNRSIGVFEKNFQKFLEDSKFVWHRCGHGAVGGAFGDTTNQELSEAFPSNLATRTRNSMDCKSQDAW